MHSVRSHLLHTLSPIVICCAILLVGASPENGFAQERGQAWQNRAQQSKDQYEQYVDKHRDRILEFARKQGREYRAAVERAQKKGIPLRFKNEAGKTLAAFYGFSKSGQSLYVSSASNEQSAQIINTKPLWSPSWNVNGGKGEQIGLWEFEGRPLGTHQEFGGTNSSRVHWEDTGNDACRHSSSTSCYTRYRDDDC